MRNSSNGRAVEWITSAPAKEIKERIAECGLQSIFVRLRIFSYFGWRAVNRYFYWPILDFYKQPQHSSAQCLNLYWSVLQYILRLDPNESNEFCWMLFIDYVINIECIVTSLNLVSATDQSHPILIINPSQQDMLIFV